MLNQQHASTQRQVFCDDGITDAAHSGFVTAIPVIPPDQLAQDKTMTRNAKSLSGVWAQSTKASHYNAPPAQPDFYALLGAAYLLLIAGGFFAICLSVMSLTDH